MRYFATINNRRRYFTSRDEALEFANRYFARTGVIIGIEGTS